MAEQFTYVNDRNQKQTITIEDQDLTLIQKDKIITDVKMKSKPTTYFKDAMRRFAKNKSSIVGAVILGLLLVLSFLIPAVSPYDTSSYHDQEVNMAPRLFNAGTGWWDGTRERKNITCAFDWDQYDKDGTYSGLPADTLERDVVNGMDGITYSKVGEKFVDSYSAYARGGYLRLWTAPNLTYTVPDYPALNTPDYNYNFMSGNDYTLKIVTADSPSYEDRKFGGSAGYEGTDGEYAICFDYLDDDGKAQSVVLKDFSAKHGEFEYDLGQNEEIKSYLSGKTLPMFQSSNEAHISFKIKPQETVSSLLIQSVEVVPSKASEAESLVYVNSTDANATSGRSNESVAGSEYSIGNSASRSLYHADIVTCNFRYDDYAHAYGDRKADDPRAITLSTSQMTAYVQAGYFNKTVDEFNEFLTKFGKESGSSQKRKLAEQFAATVKLSDYGKAKSPIRISDDSSEPLVIKVTSAAGKTTMSFGGTVSMYRYLGYNSVPRFLFGSDAKGQDMLTKTFIGLRTSLLIGVCVSVVCMAFGLLWGSISGYFGGWVDIWMERFVEILSGMPWICIMTIALIKFGQNWGTFIIAECATGWIGTSSLTRTQFYRFKDREYILAARTLGASDARLIFRHILPNAIGTLITSMVLMIPSTIFSESTLAYLNLIGGLDSLGIILSDNQNTIQSNPNLIVFPSVIMALIMISFNLFGNGLRDAFNPSLKGQE